MSGWRIIEGDCREVLRSLDAESVQTCVTSPPYFGLRDYGHDGQLGLEPTPDEYVAALVETFREVRRVLRDDGTLWLNLGDSYAATGTTRWPNTSDGYGNGYGKHGAWHGGESIRPGRGEGVKPKDLIGIPWRVAFALQADGWYLRSDIIWAKPNPMPESVTDRPTKAHEYLFLLAKGPRYFYDADAIREAAAESTQDRAHLGSRPLSDRQRHMQDAGMHGESDSLRDYSRSVRNRRSVWTVATQPFSGWGLADRRVRVAPDDADDDTQRIASPDCPVHAGRSAPAPTARRGGRAAPRSRRSPDTHVDPAQAPLLDSAPTGPHPGPDSADGSSDSPARPCAPAATPHSTGSRRTDPAPATSPACTPSAETAPRTGGTSTSPESSEQDPDTPGRSSDGDDSAGPRGSGSVDRTAHRPSLSAGSACTCEFYRIERTDHFATFPPKLIEPCILAGSRPDDVVLDPFAGAGTTGVVAARLDRSFVGVELNPTYAEMARQRIRDDAPLLNTSSERAA